VGSQGETWRAERKVLKLKNVSIEDRNSLRDDWARNGLLSRRFNEMKGGVRRHREGWEGWGESKIGEEGEEN